MRVATASLLLLALCACSLLDPRPDRTQFFVLATADELSRAAPVAGRATLTVGLGPIELPEYVRTTSLVTRTNATQITPSRTERWGEPIESAVERVLAADLARALGVPSIDVYPWFADRAPPRQVSVAFARFEREVGEQVVLVARWRVCDTATRAVALERESRISRVASGPGGAATALALSHALADLAAEIAGALR